MKRDQHGTPVEQARWALHWLSSTERQGLGLSDDQICATCFHAKEGTSHRRDGRDPLRCTSPSAPLVRNFATTPRATCTHGYEPRASYQEVIHV